MERWTRPPELIYRVKRQIRFHEDWSIQIASQIRRWTARAVAACVLVAGAAWLGMAHLNDTSRILNPIRDSVLTSIYDSSTLDLYWQQGIIEEDANQKPVILDDPPEEPVSKSEQENASP